MNERDGGPAFPQGVAEILGRGATSDEFGFPGMSLRDWFAGQALIGLLACPDIILGGPKDYASRAFEHADAMLAERAK